MFTKDRANVWLDLDGSYCAAATIIRASGQLALVERTATENNFIRLADVVQGPQTVETDGSNEQVDGARRSMRLARDHFDAYRVARGAFRP